MAASNVKSSYRMPVAACIAGSLIGGTGAVLRLLASKPTASLAVAGVLILLAGAAMLVGGVVSLLFAWATNRSFEWFLAWRYLRRTGRSWKTFVVGVLLLLVGVGLLVGSRLAAADEIGGIAVAPTQLQRALQAAALGAFRLGSWVLIFGVLLLSFSVFTAISIFGVYLGTSALVVVLSVMGGFEQDLRTKILGTRAHVVVTKPKRVFSEYREVVRKLESIQGVGAVSPYIDGEVMLTSQTNLSGVLLRGVDPERVDRVTELRRYLEAKGGSGKLSHLEHPEQLARVSPTQRFKPMVSPPLGGDDDIPPAFDEPGEPAANGPGRDGGAASDRDAAAAALPKRDRAVAGPSGPSPPQADADSALGEASKKPASRPASRPAPGPAVAAKRPKRPVYPGVIVGAELARNLRLYVGDDVNLVSPLGGMSPIGPVPKSRPFRVAGIFYSGMYEYDTKFAYVTIPVAQRFLGLGDEVTGIEIKARSVEEASQLAERIRERLGSSYRVRDWQQLNKNLFSALKLEKVVMFIVLTFIVLVASFSIATNLIMMVLEKQREIAVLKALGAGHRGLLRVFIYAGIYIGVIGMLVGVIEGVGVCAYLAQIGLPLDPEVYYISQLPVQTNPLDLSLVALAAVSISLVATIYPAVRAGQLEPVAGLRKTV